MVVTDRSAGRRSSTALETEGTISQGLGLLLDGSGTLAKPGRFRSARVAFLSNPGVMTDQHGHKRLADFVRQNEASIVREWVEFARTISPGSDKMSKLALEDHIVDILGFVADDLESAQTPRERFDKSRGKGPKDGPFSESAAEIHAALRLADGFDIDQMVSEYRALRASVVKLWLAHHQALASTDIEDLTRFNESIDQAVTESVARYTKTINNSRNLFLGVLGHDLRNPIGAVSMGAEWIERSGTISPKQAKVVSEIRTAAGRATQILNDLLDLTRSSFGAEIPVVRTKTDIVSLCREIADEHRAVDPDRRFEVTHEGDPMGSCDPARLGQVLSNLLGNAVQYSNGSSPITVRVAGNDPETVTITVHNLGTPIPVETQKVIFQSWVRGQDVKHPPEQGTHLGLGLYISKLIAEAHGGDLSVASSEAAGTTFSLRLPRS
jgi:signal transduction histidine kinase